MVAVVLCWLGLQLLLKLRESPALEDLIESSELGFRREGVWELDYSLCFFIYLSYRTNVMDRTNGKN